MPITRIIVEPLQTGFRAGLIAALWLVCVADPPVALADPVEEEAAAESLKSASADAPAKNPVRVVSNQRFSSNAGREGLCDVYCPSGPSPESGHPAVVVVHGGAWLSGDKWTLEGYSRNLAMHGFVAVTINYRLAPTHKFPAQVDDVRSALLWAKQNSARFAIDVNRMGLFGYSAGGHLSALVASLANEPVKVRAAASDWEIGDSRWGQLPSVRAVCAGGPPCDFRPLAEDNSTLSYFLGGSRRELPEIYIAASPTAHISPGDPVTQIIHGESDLLVPISASRRFHQLQKEAGIDSRFVVMPKQGHMLTFLNPKTTSKVVEFFEEVLAPSAN